MQDAGNGLQNHGSSRLVAVICRKAPRLSAASSLPHGRTGRANTQGNLPIRDYETPAKRQFRHECGLPLPGFGHGDATGSGVSQRRAERNRKEGIHLMKKKLLAVATASLLSVGIVAAQTGSTTNNSQTNSGSSTSDRSQPNSMSSSAGTNTTEQSTDQTAPKKKKKKHTKKSTTAPSSTTGSSSTGPTGSQ
jgi:hypothetical protein